MLPGIIAAKVREELPNAKTDARGVSSVLRRLRLEYGSERVPERKPGPSKVNLFPDDLP